MSPQLHKLKFSDNTLISAVIAYNKCVNPGESTLAPVTSSRKRISVGLKAGVVGRITYPSHHSSVPELKLNPKMGFTLAGWINFPLGNRVSLDAALAIVKKNGSLSHNGRNYELSTIYSNIPFSVRYSPKVDNFRPFISVGVVGGYLLHQDNSIRIYDSYSNHYIKEQIPLRSDAYGIRVCAGLYRSRKKAFGIEYLFERIIAENKGAIPYYIAFIHTNGLLFNFKL